MELSRNDMNNIMLDVMVFTPVWRLEQETVRALFAIEWDGALSWYLQEDNPGGNGRVNHLHQYQIMLF